MDDLAYAEKMTADLLKTLEQDSHDTTAAINNHNYVVGKHVIISFNINY